MQSRGPATFALEHAEMTGPSDVARRFRARVWRDWRSGVPLTRKRPPAAGGRFYEMPGQGPAMSQRIGAASRSALDR
ncbi:hypothetical protein GCM10010298_68300 [Streptomyces microflavus]|nr:hypothetical protein GCM10010298_68300 [Streptomyces microflavus]